eukprot:Clim_evm4s229 gene=Clim_evmTU4s229
MQLEDLREHPAPDQDFTFPTHPENCASRLTEKKSSLSLGKDAFELSTLSSEARSSTATTSTAQLTERIYGTNGDTTSQIESVPQEEQQVQRSRRKKMQDQTVAISLLGLSSCVMIAAWYTHLKFPNWPVWQAILVSWAIALGEYSLQVPANSIGYEVMSASQLRVIAEAFTIVAFAAFSRVVLQEPMTYNFLVAFFLIMGGVAFAFLGPFHQIMF